MTTQHILVPLDTSSFGEGALPFGLRAAQSLDAPVELVSVYDDRPMVAGWPLDPARIREATEAYQSHVADLVRDHHDIEVHRTILAGDVTNTLVEYAQRSEPKMVVMSTHGRGPVRRSWFGGVADRMMTHVSCPVLVVPAKEGQETVDLETVPVFHKIVIPLDGSRRAERSLEWAYRLGDPSDAQYALVRGVPEPNIPISVYLPDATSLREDAIRHGTDEAAQYVDTFATYLRETGRKICTEVFPGGNVATNIHRFVEKTGSDLLVIASHGRSGFSRMLLGSIADRLIRVAEHPILVVRSV